MSNQDKSAMPRSGPVWAKWGLLFGIQTSGSITPQNLSAQTSEPSELSQVPFPCCWELARSPSLRQFRGLFPTRKRVSPRALLLTLILTISWELELSHSINQLRDIRGLRGEERDYTLKEMQDPASMCWFKEGVFAREGIWGSLIKTIETKE